MNNYISPIDSYLTQVRLHLAQKLPPQEIEDILNELRAHIWDSAHQISRTSTKTLDQSFEMAIQQLETPEVLAAKFTEYLPNNQPVTHPMAPSHPLVPRQTLNNQQYIIIAIAGLFFSVFLILLIELSISQLPGSVDFEALGSMVRGIFWIIAIIAFIVYKDQKKHEEQSQKFRQVILKGGDPGKISTKTRLQFLGVHFSGFIEALFSIIVIGLVLYASYVAEYEIFNDNWFDVVIYAIIIDLLYGFVVGAIKMFVGEIRISHLIQASRHVVSAVVLLITINFYPFTFDAFLADRPAIQVQSIFESVDQSVILVLSAIVIIHFMQAIYDVFKYGIWKPHHKKSLVIT